MCRVTFLALLSGSSCCLLRAIAYTMGLQLLQLIYGSACVYPVKLSCGEGLKTSKKRFVLVSLKVALLWGLKCKSYWLAVCQVDSWPHTANLGLNPEPPIRSWEHVWFKELPIVTQTHLPCQCAHIKTLLPFLLLWPLYHLHKGFLFFIDIFDVNLKKTWNFCLVICWVTCLVLRPSHS